MAKPNFKPIPAFSLCGVSTWGVSLIRHDREDENGDPIELFGAVIDLELDGKDEKHFVSLATEIVDPCPHCAAREAVMAAGAFGDEYFMEITVLDAETGEEVQVDDDRLEVGKLLEEIYEEPDVMDYVEPPTKTLH